MLTSMVHALEPDIASRLRSVPTRRQPMYRATEIEPGVVYEHGGMKVSAFEVPDWINPAFGYRIDVNGRSVVLSCDTRYSETLIENAQGVDVLVHEVVLGSPTMTTEQRSIANVHTLPDIATKVHNVANLDIGLAQARSLKPPHRLGHVAAVDDGCAA
jgi:ribonuclease Z